MIFDELKINLCDICERKKGKYSAGIFVLDKEQPVYFGHPTGFYLFVCPECYFSYLAQDYGLSIKGIEWYIKTWLEE